MDERRLLNTVTSLLFTACLIDCGGDPAPTMMTTTVDHVACGSSSCDTAKGESCCLGASLSCKSACSDPAVSCDGPEDCSGGAFCCLNNGTFACSATCDAAQNQVRLCHSLKDCGSDSNVCLAKNVGQNPQATIALGECMHYDCTQTGCDLSKCPTDQPCSP